MAHAARIVAQCDQLTAISSMPNGIRRVYLSPEHARANLLVDGWMRRAGLRTWQDAAGNLHGSTIAESGSERPILILGSHLDSVTDAGRYDGVVGVLMAIATAERLRARWRTLAFAIEVIAFWDEEGTRFGKALLGSAAVSGRWDDSWWSLPDDDGMTLLDAFVRFGLDPDRVGDAAADPRLIMGYLEAHIEQGPLLDHAGQPLAVVSSIAGARRFSVEIIGEARHAGGTPYESRRDALLGASEVALVVERVCRAEQHIGTVGSIAVSPGATNVVPGRAVISVDLRGERDHGIEKVWSMITGAVDEISARRGLIVTSTELHRAPAVVCAPRMKDAVRVGIEASGLSDPQEIFSKAGHDAMSFESITDVGMLFLRNPGGISHHADEFVAEADIAIGLDAMAAAVLALAEPR